MKKVEVTMKEYTTIPNEMHVTRRGRTTAPETRGETDVALRSFWKDHTRVKRVARRNMIALYTQD